MHGENCFPGNFLETVYDKDENFYKKSNINIQIFVWSKVVILVKNRKYGQKSKFQQNPF